MSLQELIDGWETSISQGSPYMFPGDKETLQEANHKRFICPCQSLDKFNLGKEFANRDDSKLHLELIPVPWVGDVRQASVFILSLNPGFDPLSYFSETRQDLRDALLANVRQEKLDSEFPFMALNPRFVWYSGFTYWESRLRSLVDKIKQSKSWDSNKALSLVAQEICVLQLVPYWSRNFDLPRSILSSLRSSSLVRDFAQQKAKESNALIVVARRSRDWGLAEDKLVIRELPPATRGQRFSPTTIDRLRDWLLDHAK